MDVDPLIALTHRAERPTLLARSVFDATLTPAIDASTLPDLVKAGLHVLNDDLDSAHKLAQSLEGDSTADYWHAIVHRREGDFANSKYWFARVDEHPVIKSIHGGVDAAIDFVDRCRSVAKGRDDEAEEVQWRELLALLKFSDNL